MRLLRCLYIINQTIYFTFIIALCFSKCIFVASSYTCHAISRDCMESFIINLGDTPCEEKIQTFQ